MAAAPGILGEMLSAGRTAEIYRWSETEVIKLYQPWVSRETVERERSNTRAAWEMGLPAPHAGDIRTLAGRTGLILERIQGHTMMSLLEQDISLGVQFARELAKLHAWLNSKAAGEGLPSQRAMLQQKIGGCELLRPSEREAVLAALSRMPAGDRFCHGDFHPGNIIVAAPGRCRIIDWMDASAGNPAADLARSSILFLGHIAITPLSAKTRGLMERFHRTYLQAYLRRANVRQDEYAAWLPIVAAARLSEGIAEFEECLLEQVRAG